MKHTFNVTCGCCGANGSVTYEGHKWIAGGCEKGCTFLSMPNEMHTEFCRMVDEAEVTV